MLALMTVIDIPLSDAVRSPHDLAQAIRLFRSVASQRCSEFYTKGQQIDGLPAGSDSAGECQD